MMKEKFGVEKYTKDSLYSMLNVITIGQGSGYKSQKIQVLSNFRLSDRFSPPQDEVWQGAAHHRYSLACEISP